MKVEVCLTEQEIAAIPDFSDRLARFQISCDWLGRDMREKFRLCLHEAGHIVFFRRLGWAVGNFQGPHICLNKEGTPRNILGSVTPVRGEFHCADVRRELIEKVKTDIAGFVLVEAITGEPEEETVIQNDLGVISTFESDALEVSTQEIIQELHKDGFIEELMEAAREYETAVFQTDEACSWGWKEYRLDLPGQRYVVGPSWLLIVHEDCLPGFSPIIRSLRFFVQFNGKELLPNDVNFQYVVPPRAIHGGERAADAVRRWNEMVRGAL